MSNFFRNLLTTLSAPFEDAETEERVDIPLIECAPEPTLSESVKKRLTKEILAGDTSGLEKLIRQYQHQPKEKRNSSMILLLFQDNPDLNVWVEKEADPQMVVKLWGIINPPSKDEGD